MQSKTRPRIVTWLIVGVLFFSTLFIIRFILSLQTPELPTSVPRWYLPLTGALWSTLGLVVCISLIRSLSWAPKILQWGSVSFAAWYWLDRLFFVRSEYGRSIWPSALVVSLITLILIFLSQRRSEVKAYFQERVNE